MISLRDRVSRYKVKRTATCYEILVTTPHHDNRRPACMVYKATTPKLIIRRPRCVWALYSIFLQYYIYISIGIPLLHSPACATGANSRRIVSGIVTVSPAFSYRFFSRCWDTPSFNFDGPTPLLRRPRCAWAYILYCYIIVYILRNRKAVQRSEQKKSFYYLYLL